MARGEQVADELRVLTGAIIRRLRTESAGQLFTWQQVSLLRRSIMTALQRRQTWRAPS